MPCPNLPTRAGQSRRVLPLQRHATHPAISPDATRLLLTRPHEHSRLRLRPRTASRQTSPGRTSLRKCPSRVRASPRQMCLVHRRDTAITQHLPTTLPQLRVGLRPTPPTPAATVRRRRRMVQVEARILRRRRPTIRVKAPALRLPIAHAPTRQPLRSTTRPRPRPTTAAGMAADILPAAGVAEDPLRRVVIAQATATDFLP